MHAFYPYYQRIFNTQEVSGGVAWLYRDSPKRIGITIEEVEKNFDDLKRKLYCIEESMFYICPQILFVFFKQAVGKFVVEINAVTNIQRLFC
jgi:hypothetical protein